MICALGGRAARGGFDWLQWPVLNKYTRLASVADAASGTLWVQGFERDGPATRVLALQN